METTSNNEIKRQHYVPITYLKHFSEERSGGYFINTLPIKSFNEDSIKERNVANICLERGLYTLPGDSVEERMLIEKFYSDNYESYYDKIYQILTDPYKITLTNTERELIISTVVTMFYRTTKWVNQFNEFSNRTQEKVFSLCKQFGKDYYIAENQKVSISNKTLEQKQKENKMEIRPIQVISQLQHALKLIKLRSIQDGICVVKLIDDDCDFVTSDNPVCISNFRGGYIVPFDPENIMTLPLDNKHKLYLMPFIGKNAKHVLSRTNFKGRKCISEKLISNFDQSKNAERFMLGTETALKKFLLAKEKLNNSLTKEGDGKNVSFDDLL